jgi:glycosyltransferase involved in cell wall biosynthesis
VRRELKISDGALVVLLPGIIIEWKGQHVLLEAIPEVARQVPGVVFLFAGSTAYDRDPYLDGLLHRSQTLGLSETAQFLGHRSDILDLMYLADVVVHTSTSPEPFGRVIVEGMLCGKPVVATQIGGPEEIIKSGRTGILLPPGDPVALSTALIELLQSPDLREAIGRRAMSHAQASYGIDRHAEAVTQVIERAYQRSAGP